MLQSRAAHATPQVGGHTAPTRWPLIVLQGRSRLRLSLRSWRALEALLEPGGLLFVCKPADPLLAAHIRAAASTLHPGEWHVIEPAGEDRWRLRPDTRQAAAWFNRHVTIPYGLRSWLSQSLALWLPRALTGPESIRLLPVSSPAEQGEAEGALPAGILSSAQISRVTGRPVRLPMGFMYVGDPDRVPHRKLLFLLERGESRPTALVKWAQGPLAQSLYNEQEALERLQADADPALRARSPRSLGPIRAGAESVVMVQSYLPGRSLYARFRTGLWPRLLVRTHFKAAADWLASYHRATRQPPRPLDGTVLYEQIEQPLSEAKRYFGSKVIPDAHYDQTLRQAHKHLGYSVRLVDEHGDFWPSNLLLSRNQVHVIDWEHFRPAALPGFDMLVFCAAYSMHFPWRPFGWAAVEESFAATFLHKTWMSKYVAGLLDRGYASNGLPYTLIPVMLAVTLCRMAVRRTQAVPQGPSTPRTDWLQMLEAWWRRPPENWLEIWALKKQLSVDGRSG